jgi:hypothetical protein
MPSTLRKSLTVYQYLSLRGYFYSEIQHMKIIAEPDSAFFVMPVTQARDASTPRSVLGLDTRKPTALGFEVFSQLQLDPCHLYRISLRWSQNSLLR